MVAKNLEHFYKKYGFVRRPNENNGEGMTYSSS